MPEAEDVTPESALRLRNSRIPVLPVPAKNTVVIEKVAPAASRGCRCQPCAMCGSRCSPGLLGHVRGAVLRISAETVEDRLLADSMPNCPVRERNRKALRIREPKHGFRCKIKYLRDSKARGRPGAVPGGREKIPISEAGRRSRRASIQDAACFSHPPN